VSRPNVDVVRDWMRACVDGDLAAALEIADPAIEMNEAPNMPGAHSLRGHDALQRYFAGWERNWSDWKWHADEVIDVPPDKVVVDARLSLRGLRSTVWVERAWAYVFTVRDGKLVRQDAHEGRAQALEAAGAAA
jgi:ketosteroid isomerase-like protein